MLGLPRLLATIRRSSLARSPLLGEQRWHLPSPDVEASSTAFLSASCSSCCWRRRVTLVQIHFILLQWPLGAKQVGELGNSIYFDGLLQ